MHFNACREGMFVPSTKQLHYLKQRRLGIVIDELAMPQIHTSRGNNPTLEVGQITWVIQVTFARIGLVHNIWK